MDSIWRTHELVLTDLVFKKAKIKPPCLTAPATGESNRSYRLVENVPRASLAPAEGGSYDKEDYVTDFNCTSTG